MTDTGPLRGPLKKRESNLWERQAHDWYVEPSWVSARLFEAEPFAGTILDPACGGGNIVRSARAAGFTCEGRDVVQRSPECGEVRDWLDPSVMVQRVDNIVSNPPFKLCDDRKAGTNPFVQKCLWRTRHKVALLLPANWIQGDQRSRWLEETPLYRVWFISPRPSMPPGEIVASGVKPGSGTTDYAWFIWLNGYDGDPQVKWLRRNP